MKNKIQMSVFVLCLLWALGRQGQVFAQDTPPILENYLREALQNHEGIKQQQFVLEKNLVAVQEAKKLYLPQSTLKADYFLAGGGRTVDLPVGDLVNPAYQALNQITQSNAFPTLENQSILLNPNNFYDIKVRTAMPLFNKEIQYNYRIKKQQVTLQSIEIQLFKRELVKEVKKAYYQYLQAEEATKIYEQSLALVRESKRITEKLLANGGGNKTAIQRAENEVINLTSEIEKAKNVAKNAKAYFNFLLNRPLETEINLIPQTQDFPQNAENTTAKREELAKINMADSLTQQSILLTKAYKMPKASTFLDLGSQGFKWKVNNKTPYYFFGVSLEWNLFSFGKNKLKVQQAEKDLQVIRSQQDQIADQLNLQLAVAQNNYRSALEQYKSAKSREETSAKVYRDVQKMYQAGQAIFIELLDAQNQYITAQNQRNIALTDIWLKWVEVERANASYNL